MKTRLILLISVITYILQTTIVAHIQIGGIHPNLLIMVLVIFILIFDNNEGYYVAIIFGLLQDIMATKALGINTLIYVLIALTLYQFKEVFFSEFRVSVMIATAIAGFFYHMAYYTVSVFILDNTRTFLFAFSTGTIELLLNILIVYIIYPTLFKYLKGHPLN
jgi:rod shape-determining protein MreD